MTAIYIGDCVWPQLGVKAIIGVIKSSHHLKKTANGAAKGALESARGARLPPIECWAKLHPPALD
jgi:hypothetical protein